MITIGVTSVFVEDQNKAMNFYTEVLSFEKKQDIPLGEARRLTVISPAAPDGVELLLEPNPNPIAKTYQRVHHGADGDEPGDRCDVRRHLRQPHRSAPGRLSAAADTARLPRRHPPQERT